MQLNLKNKILSTLFSIIIVYIVICFYVFYNQEKFLFLHYKVGQNYTYNIDAPFEEKNFITTPGVLINGLYFKNNKPNGIVIINRGSGGTLKNYHPNQNYFYKNLNYDVFIYDYRGNGKSQGKSKGMESLFYDLKHIYNYFSEIYNEKNIILIGNSFGTGIATKIASENNPKFLILQAPYYEYNDLLKHRSGWMPLELIIKYNFKTFQYLEKCTSPVILVHGANDNIIKPESSERLYEHINSEKHLLIIKDAGHTHLGSNPEYHKMINHIFK